MKKEGTDEKKDVRLCGSWLMEFVRNVDWITESRTVDIRPEMGHRIGGTKRTREERFKFQKKRLGRKQSYRRQNLLRIVQAEKKTSGKKGTKIFAGIVLFLFLINIVSSLAGEIQEFLWKEIIRWQMSLIHMHRPMRF